MPAFTHPGARFDGCQSEVLWLWTILDGGPAHGATISLRINEASAATLASKISATHAKFSGL